MPCQHNLTLPQIFSTFTAHAFVEMARFLLKEPGVKFLLSERFCQDLLKPSLVSSDPKEDEMTTPLLSSFATIQYL